MAKHYYDRAMYRITTIMSRLNIGEKLFLPNLAQEFGVSLRTIQKDFSTRLLVFLALQVFSVGLPTQLFFGGDFGFSLRKAKKRGAELESER